MRVHSFPTGINQKVNVISRLEFELAYNGITNLHVNECDMGNPSLKNKRKMPKKINTMTQKFCDILPCPSL